jgi:hypothetical protein
LRHETLFHDLERALARDLSLDPILRPALASALKLRVALTDAVTDADRRDVNLDSAYKFALELARYLAGFLADKLGDARDSAGVPRDDAVLALIIDGSLIPGVMLGRSIEREVRLAASELASVLAGRLSDLLGMEPSPAVRAGASAPAASAGAGRQLFVGAEMKAVLAGTMPGKIDDLSLQTVQPIIKDNDSGIWSWELSRLKPGPFS